MTLVETFVDFADKFSDLVRDQSEWSQATFGTDAERGPIGALKHLEKEAREAQDSPGDIMELADCLLLILDANRRSGFKPMQLVEAAQRKMEINKARKWPKPTSDAPVEHIREEPPTVFTIAEAAKICKVAPRTVSKWFDSGRLKGYRIPGSHDRRIPREYLIKFLKEHGMPTEDVDKAIQ